MRSLVRSSAPAFVTLSTLALASACGSSTTDPAVGSTAAAGGNGTATGGSSSAGSSGASGASGASAGPGAGGAAAGNGAGGATAGTGGAAGGAAAGTGGAAGGKSGGGGSSGATGGSAGAGAAAGSGGCSPDCVKAGNTCCNGLCVNTDNDIHNCGKCGVQCAQSPSFCAAGTCGVPPCAPGQACANGGTCCENACCGAGQLCCDIPGPVAKGATCTAPNDQGTCPVGCKQCKCNSPDTPIATPSGNVRIGDLVEGDLVYSVDRGEVVAVPIARTHSVDAPDHVVVQITLESGMILEISAPHPTADGRTFGDLRAGDRLDGARVASARRVPYRHARTYDILPASDSASYFAAGMLIGSTLGASRAGSVSCATAPLSR